MSHEMSIGIRVIDALERKDWRIFTKTGNPLWESRDEVASIIETETGVNELLDLLIDCRQELFERGCSLHSDFQKRIETTLLERRK